MVITEKNSVYYLNRLALYTILIGLFLATVLPFLIMIILSFKNSDIINSPKDLLPTINELKHIFSNPKILLKNYVEVWQAGNFKIYFLNTFLITIFVVVGNIIFDTMAAYILSRKQFFGKKLIFFLIISRMMIPVQILIIPIFILIKQLSLYDTLLALALPNIIQGFGIFLMKQYFDGIPRALDEAAIIDGASDLQILRYILFPIAKPALAVLIINTALSTWNAFLLPLILTQSEAKRVLGLGLALYKSQFNVDYVHSMAASTLAVLPILLLFLFFQNYIISGLTKGAVK